MELNPIPEITEQKASGLRKYFYEYVVIALAVSVCTLFGLYYNLNNFVLNKMTDTINRSTNAIEKNTEVFQTFKK